MTADRIVIRPAAVDDAQRRDRIHFSAVHGLAAEPWYSREQLAGWSKKRLPNPEHLRAQLARGDAVFIASLGRKRVGFSELSGEYIRAVYVRATYGGRGIGAVLLDALEREAIRRGVTEVHLESSMNAVRFYESHGYVCTEQTMHRFSNGTEIACAIMRKRLVD